jgi:hypothetical protein
MDTALEYLQKAQDAAGWAAESCVTFSDECYDDSSTASDAFYKLQKFANTAGSTCANQGEQCMTSVKDGSESILNTIQPALSHFQDFQAHCQDGSSPMDLIWCAGDIAHITGDLWTIKSSIDNAKYACGWGSNSVNATTASKSHVATSATPVSLNAISIIEKLVCEVAEQKWIEEKAAGEICSVITATFPVPDCQTNLEKIWDKVTSICPQGRESMVARSAHVEGGQLGLTYKDCGDSATHAKITGLTPSTATIGRKTTITGTGEVDTDIADGTFNMQVGFSEGVPLADCQGDASVRKKCNFPFAAGSLTFDGVKFPIKAGPQNINVDLHLSPFLPASLIQTTTKITAVSKNDEKIFCIKVITGKSDANGAVSLTYEDCGDSQTHAKITSLSPRSVRLGRTTRITGTGMLDKDIMEGTFRTQTFYSGGDLLDCSGDASQSKTCTLMGGLLGNLRFNGLQFPVKKGSSSVSVDMSLRSIVPAALAKTKTKVTATTKSGEKIFCMEVFTAPVSVESNNAAVIVV